MRAPVCRLCHLPHWGDCQPASPPKPKMKPKPPAKTATKKHAKKKAARHVPPPSRRPRGRPKDNELHLSNEKTRPWEKDGISRRSWYRKLAKEEAR